MMSSTHIQSQIYFILEIQMYGSDILLINAILCDFWFLGNSVMFSWYTIRYMRVLMLWKVCLIGKFPSGIKFQ